MAKGGFRKISVTRMAAFQFLRFLVEHEANNKIFAGLLLDTNTAQERERQRLQMLADIAELVLSKLQRGQTRRNDPIGPLDQILRIEMPLKMISFVGAMVKPGSGLFGSGFRNSRHAGWTQFPGARTFALACWSATLARRGRPRLSYQEVEARLEKHDKYSESYFYRLLGKQRSGKSALNALSLLMPKPVQTD